MIGKVLSPILCEIEQTLWDFEFHNPSNPEYTIEGFKACVKIFSSAILGKMWELQELENMSINDRVNMAQKVGEEIRKLVKIYTNIDTVELYKK